MGTENKKDFFVHHSILSAASRSGFFYEASQFTYNKVIIDGESLDLPKDDPEVFARFIEALYNKQLGWSQPLVRTSIYDLLTLYTFSNKYNLTIFHNTIMSEMWNRAFREPKYYWTMNLDKRLVGLFLSEISPSAPMHQFFSRWLAWSLLDFRSPGNNMAQRLESAPDGLVRAAMLSMLAHGQGHDQMLGTKCDFHLHPPGVWKDRCDCDVSPDSEDGGSMDEDLA